MTKLTVAFTNSVNMPKNHLHWESHPTSTDVQPVA